MKSNFEFLNRYWPALAQIGAAAESYVYSDANACLYKLGMFGERLILEIFAFEHIKEPTIDNTHANRIRLLKREENRRHPVCTSQNAKRCGPCGCRLCGGCKNAALYDL